MMTGTFDLGRVTGFSAYEVWKAQPGNENKTEQDFLKFISSGGDWINFDQTPVDFDKVRDYQTYGSTANLDTDLTRGSVPGDALSIEFSGGTFIFESKSVRNNVRKSTDYDTVQTIILFADASNQVGKYVRYGIYNDDDQLMSSKRIDWVIVDFFSDNGDHIVDIAGRLCNQFSIKIGDVTKKTDGSQNVEFTKEELGLEGGSSGYFENIFNGYATNVVVKIGGSVYEAQMTSPRLKGDVFLIQLAPAIIKPQPGTRYGTWLPTSDSEETFTPNGEVADYSTLLLVSTMNITNEKGQPGGYQSYNNYNYDNGGLYNAVVKTEKLISLNGSTYRDVSNGTFITVKVQVDNSGDAWFDVMRRIGMPVYITNIWRLK